MKNLFFYFLFFLLSFNSFASHIIGGGFELNYRRPNIYQLKFQMYVDAVHADPGVIAAETQVIAAIFDKSNNTLMQKVTMPRYSYQLLIYDNSCIEPEVQSGVITFVGDFYMDPAVYINPQGYYVAYENCCRSGEFTNIQDPYHTGMAFYYEFPPVIVGGLPFINSSPSFYYLHDSFASLGKDYSMHFHNLDPDGDSLAYHLVTPLAGHMTPSSMYNDVYPGPYAPVQWQTGYSLSNMISGTTPLYIDDVTGILYLNANTEGMYAFAVETEEWRNGIKIGSAIREFCIFVVDTGVQDCVNAIKKDNSEHNDISISPNPCRDQLKVEINKPISGKVEVEVMNSLGVKVDQLTSYLNNNFYYSTTNLFPGVYFLIIKSDSQILSETFIKE